MTILDAVFDSPEMVVHCCTMMGWSDLEISAQALRRQDVRDTVWRIYPAGEDNFLRAARAAGWVVGLVKARDSASYKVPLYWEPCEPMCKP